VERLNYILLTNTKRTGKPLRTLDWKLNSQTSGGPSTSGKNEPCADQERIAESNLRTRRRRRRMKEEEEGEEEALIIASIISMAVCRLSRGESCSCR
jgi:hypothetical protein